MVAGHLVRNFRQTHLMEGSDRRDLVATGVEIGKADPVGPEVCRAERRPGLSSCKGELRSQRGQNTDLRFGECPPDVRAAENGLGLRQVALRVV